MIAAQLLLNAVALGMAYALIALGFVLALNAAGAVNFAHGDLVVLGGGVAVALAFHLAAPAWLLVPLVVLVLGAVGVLAARVAILPLVDRPPETTFVATIALAAIVEHALTLAMAGAPATVPAVAGAGAVQVLGVAVGRQQLAILVLGGAAILLVWLLLERSWIGTRMRAVAMDRTMARAVGIPAGRYIAATFALSGALAGLAGLLLGHQFLVSPTQGAGYMLKAYIAVALGGWGSVPGALLAALGIGAFESLASAWVGDAWAQGALYVGVIATLALRPQGLFGEPAGRRV